MKHVTAFVASARKKHTYNAVRTFLDSVQAHGDVESDIVMLAQCNLQICRGCKACCDRGEHLCPLKDDRDVLLDRMMRADAVVFASPVYSFQVSGLMKVFLDRLGFAFHRPRFFGKTFTSIVVEAIYGGNKAMEYLDFVGDALGFNVVKGSKVLSLEPMTDEQQQKNQAILVAHGNRFHERLLRPSLRSPTLMHLMMFRWGRTSIQAMLDESWADYTYYRDKGWFESEYFYPVRLNPIKKAVGRFFDYKAAKGAKASFRSAGPAANA